MYRTSMYRLRQFTFYILTVLIYIVFSIVFIETKFQDNLGVLNSENLPTFNGNCPHSLEESVLILRYNQIKLNSSAYLYEVNEFEGTIPECSNNVVGSNYEQNIALSEVSDLILVVEDLSLSKIKTIFNIFLPLLVFFSLGSLFLFYLTQKDFIIVSLILFIFLFSIGIEFVRTPVKAQITKTT